MQFGEYAVFRQSLDFYFGSTIYALGIFLICIKHPELGQGIMSFIGKRLSMIVYIVHMLAISMTIYFLSFFGDTIQEWSSPVLAIALSLLIATVCWKIHEFFTDGKQQEKLIYK